MLPLQSLRKVVPSSFKKDVCNHVLPSLFVRASAALRGPELPVIQGNNPLITTGQLLCAPDLYAPALPRTCPCKGRHHLAEAIGEDEVFGMAYLTPPITGLPMCVWTTMKRFTPGPPCLRVQKSYRVRALVEFWFSVMLEEPPMVVGDTGLISDDDVAQVKHFAEVNRRILLEYWEGACVSKLLDELVIRS